MKSPFKFLDSYTKNDREIFFGRDREIEELYQKVFESKLLLVYGVSGTGKSSLIHCGLANKFQDTDWLPLVIRRGANMLESLATAIKNSSLTQMQGEIATASQFRKAVRSLYLDHYKPIYFIFDQFEEMFIFGTKEEDENFIKVLKFLLASEIQCRFIFILREEFLGWLSTFEKSVPGFFSNRMRVEKMDIGNARNVIEGPCKIFNIALEEGFADKMIEKLCPPKESEIELTYLQVYLDKIFRQVTKGIPEKTGSITFRISDLAKAGNVYDILGSFLDEQISHLPDPELAMTVLKAFVSARGTKRPASIEEIKEYTQTTGKNIDEKTINDLLNSFVNLRILQEKGKNEKYELRHDAIASKIFEKITLVEKELLEIRQLIENAYHNWQKRGVLLSAEDLQYIAPYESRLYLAEDHRKLIESSKKELIKARQRRRNLITAATVALIIILSGFTFWAVRERGKAVNNEKIANEERIKATASEKEAIIARDNAIESDKKAIASEKEAIAARNRAEESELRIKREKELTEIRERQARANNYNYLSKEIVTEDPTTALRLAEYALSLDPENKDIVSNLNSIYYDNSFYKVFSRYREGNLCQISPDWTKVISTNGRSAEITDLDGNNPRILIGHLVYGFTINDVHGFARNGYDNISSLAFSGDGNYIITGSNDKTARLWDIDGNILQIFTGHVLPVYAVAFSPDGNTVLTGSGDLTARLWDLQGNCLQVFNGHKFDVLSVAFSPDGNKILTGSADSTAILWDLQGNILQRFQGHTGYIRNVAFTPDGESILTGSYDHTVRLWDINGKMLHEFNGHSDNIRSLAFAPDGKRIITGSADKTARLWDLEGNTIQILKGHTGSVNFVAFSPDGKRILTFCTDGISRIWDLSQNVYKTFTGHTNIVYRVLFSPDGKTIMTLGVDRTIRLWDLDGNNKQTIKVFSNSVAFSPDGNTILTGMVTAQLLDLTGNVRKTFIGHTKGIMAVTFSPDGKTILTGAGDKTARLWDLNANTLQTFTGHSDVVTSVAFSPDGKTILTGSNDNTARIWDLNGNTIQVLSGHTDYVKSAVFSPDGRTILTGSDDKTARLWDLNGNTVQIFKGHSQYLNSAVFSPDGKLILTGSDDKTARLWDLNGNTLQILSGYLNPIYSVAFSPDGTKILTGSGDNTARLVNVKMPLNTFLRENSCAYLNPEQKLQYEIVKVDQVIKEKETSKLFEGLKFCLSQAKLPNNKNEKYLKEADVLIRKIWSNITSLKSREQFITYSLDLYALKPQKYLKDRIEESNQMLLSTTTKDEIKEVFDFYSEKCSNLDSVRIIMHLPESFIKIAERLYSIDTTARKTISIDLSGLSWPLLQYRQFKSSLDAVTFAIEADSTNQYNNITYPLALVLNNRFDEASKIYLKYYKKSIFNHLYGSYRLIYLGDISDLKKRGITHPDFGRVNELLNN